MGRPPCCDKVGMKKGPWTPEEDIKLVSYVQEHGPGNWRAVPTNTGLRRCSKSCRLRWTNYLRPGIKRGNFTDHEEKTIIQLQALLGNKWAAIASYLPERTDNDIKNYWNTHLTKKLKKLESGSDAHSTNVFASSNSISRGQWERRLQTDIKMAKQALQDALSIMDKPSFASKDQSQPCTSTYASSTENIARLLQGWMNDSARATQKNSSSNQHSFNQNGKAINEGSTSSEETLIPSAENKSGIDLSEAFESLFGFESFESSNSDISQSMSPEASLYQGESKPNPSAQFPLSLFESWLLYDDGVAQGKTESNTTFPFDEKVNFFLR